MHILIEVESTAVAAKIEELLKEHFGTHRIYDSRPERDDLDGEGEPVLEIGIDGGEA